MNYRLRPTDICMADAMPFQQHHEARVAGRDLADLLTDDLFLNVRNNLRVGDQVVLCGYADQSWARLQQFVTLRITSLDEKAVKFMMDGEIKAIPVEKAAPAAKKKAAPLEVAKEFGGGYNVIEKASGHVLEKFKTKAEAETWAKAHAGA